MKLKIKNADSLQQDLGSCLQIYGGFLYSSSCKDFSLAENMLKKFIVFIFVAVILFSPFHSLWKFCFDGVILAFDLSYMLSQTFLFCQFDHLGF